MGFGKYFSDKVSGDKELRDLEEQAKRQRLLMAVSMMEKLAERGLNPDEINNTVNSFVANGTLAIPSTRQVRAEGPATEQGYLPMIQEPVRLGKQPKKYFAPGDGGKYTQVELPEGAGTDFDAEFVKSPDANGYDIYVNAQTGEEIRREPNGQRGNRTVRVGASGAGRSDPELATKRQVHSRYLAAQAKGEIPDDLQAEMKSAAPGLGIKMEKVTVPPSKFKAFFGAKATTYERPVFSGSQSSPESSEYEKPEDVRRAYREGSITKEEAMDLLENMGE